MAWIKACSVTDFEPDAGVRVEADPPVAVFHADGEYFAIADTCTHGESSLADGFLDGTEVECSWHFAKFCLRDGRALTLPATQDVATYPVRVQDDIVFVEV